MAVRLRWSQRYLKQYENPGLRYWVPHSEIQIRDMTQILSKLQIYIKHESAFFMLDIYQV